jgi:hypothetical protein
MRSTRPGEKNIVVTPDVPMVRFVVGGMGAAKPHVAFTVVAAVKQPGRRSAALTRYCMPAIVPRSICPMSFTPVSAMVTSSSLRMISIARVTPA